MIRGEQIRFFSLANDQLTIRTAEQTISISANGYWLSISYGYVNRKSGRSGLNARRYAHVPACSQVHCSPLSLQCALMIDSHSTDWAEASKRKLAPGMLELSVERSSWRWKRNVRKRTYGDRYDIRLALWLPIDGASTLGAEVKGDGMSIIRRPCKQFCTSKSQDMTGVEKRSQSTMRSSPSLARETMAQRHTFRISFATYP